jgi:FkbM family methyltransferase
MSDPLDQRLDKIDTSHNRLHNLVSEIEDILETLIANDTEILEALTQMLLTVPQMQARNEQSMAKLAEEVRKELRLFTAELLERTVAARPAKPLLAGNVRDATPEASLLQHLYSFLPDPVAFDIGANVGDISARLLEAGYEVYAFEPNPSIFAAMREKLGANPSFHPFQLAIGSANTTLNLRVATDPTGANKYGDPSLFSTFIEHPMPGDLPFTQEIPVSVRTIESLRQSGEIPARAGLIKIDTEGFDLEVIRGLGHDETPVVMAEFWDAVHSFGLSGKGRLCDLVAEMKTRGYRWFLVIYHEEESATLSYYCNRTQTVPNSWGNAIFFRDHALFARAHAWCEEHL